MPKLGTLLLVLVVVVLVLASLWAYSRTPIVQKSTHLNRKVACVTVEHGIQPITSAVCQTVLREGHYEVEWVR